jgi:hypothetical protein
MLALELYFNLFQRFNAKQTSISHLNLDCILTQRRNLMFEETSVTKDCSQLLLVGNRLTTCNGCGSRQRIKNKFVVSSDVNGNRPRMAAILQNSDSQLC